MFEFSVAKGYLWPKRKRLSVSLIAIMSVFVISLVVWLLILFLSITEGIEKTWLNKLTSLNAPIRIVPTQDYYDSYYYQIDSISSDSNFSYKSIGEKYHSLSSDPYNPQRDEEIPFYWPTLTKTPDGKPNDLVKNAFSSLDSLKTQWPDLKAQDYEVAGALMKLRLIRQELTMARANDQQSFLTQASYLSSFSDKNPKLKELLKSPTINDVNHLLYLANLTHAGSVLEDRPKFITSTRTPNGIPISIRSIMDNIDLKTIKLSAATWQFPNHLFPLNKKFKAYANKRGQSISYLVISKNSFIDCALIEGVLENTENGLLFTTDSQTYHFHENIPIFLNQDIICNAVIKKESLETATTVTDIELTLNMNLQGTPLKGIISWQNINIEKADLKTDFTAAPKTPPPWIYAVKGHYQLPKNAVIAPTSYQDNKVMIGDRGYLAYNAITPTSNQELRQEIYVAGFYDPGIMSVGARVLLTDPKTVRQINVSGQNISLDPLMTNGIALWFSNLNQANLIASEIKKTFKKNNIDQYWKVSTFHEYEFAKDLILQFKSDRYLFMIIGLIILLVACSNIISLLLLLVNDKKREIGILLSLGAKKRSVAVIFGICGVSMGIVSCLIGAIGAYFTLAHIDSLVYLLNFLEGQQAFNAAFYGQSLPNELSKTALFFILIVTPILSFIAGLIPAIKACRLKPSAILRSE